MTKAGQLVADDAVIRVKVAPKFVSRGGLKLEGALDHFGIDVSGQVCLDVGSSTGGFTDCLLQRGAAFFERPVHIALVAEREQVKGDERRRRRLGKHVDA